MEKSRFNGIPHRHRYSEWMKAEPHLIKAIRRVDQWLDLKFYLPTERWHLVRYPNGFDSHPVRVWELEDRPELGLHREPGMWIYHALQAADMIARGDEIQDECDNHNAAVDAAYERRIEDEAREYGKDLFHLFKRLYDYGPNADARRYF